MVDFEKRRNARLKAAVNRLRDICKNENLSFEEIRYKSRRSEYVRQRKQAAKIMRFEGYSYPTIGHAMNRDHTSVMQLVDDKFRNKKIKQNRKTYVRSRNRA